MNWIQYFNMLSSNMVDFWHRLNLWEEVLFIWLTGIFFINVFIPFFKYIYLVLFRSKKQKKMISYCNRNLKPCCLFLDHAAGTYVLSASTIVIDKDRQLFLSKDIISEVPLNGIRNFFDFDGNVSKCYGVSFFAHNRLQSIEADEAHWFTFKLYRTDLITRAILKEVIKCSKKKNSKLDQAVDINNIYPFVTSVHLVVNLYYKRRGRYYLLISKENRFLFDVEVTPNIFDGTNNFSSEIVDFFENLIREEGFNPLTEVCFTDIGFDSNNLQLLIIGHACIDYSNILKNRKHLKINNNVKEIMALIDEKDDYKSFFAYSCINLRTFILNSSK